jgi:hypothetical protein
MRVSGAEGERGCGRRTEHAQGLLRDPMTLAMRNSFDDSVQAQAPEVECHFAYGVTGWVEARQSSG